MMRTREKDDGWINQYSTGNTLYAGFHYLAYDMGQTFTQKYFHPFSDFLDAKMVRPAPVSVPPFYGHCPGKWSRISDVNNGTSRKESPVRHSRVESRQATHDFVAGGPDPASMGVWGYQLTRGRLIPPVAPSEPAMLSQTDIDRCRVEAWSAFQPQLSSGFAGANFLYELKDLKSMKQLFSSRHLKDSAKKLLDWITSRDVGERTTLATKTGASLNLEYKFNISPLCRDISTLMLLCMDLRHKLDKFNAQGLVANKVHFTKHIPGNYQRFTGPWNGLYDYDRVWSEESVFRAQVQSTWHHEVDNMFDMFLQYYGLRLTPKAIWNAIPLSFIVDMLFTVSESLETISKTAVSKVNLCNYTESLTDDGVYAIFLRNEALGNYPGRNLLWSRGVLDHEIRILSGKTDKVVSWLLPENHYDKAQKLVSWSRYRNYARTPYAEVPFNTLAVNLPLFRWGDQMKNPGSKLLTLGSMLASGLGMRKSARTLKALNKTGDLVRFSPTLE